MKSYTAKTLEDLLQSVAAEKNTTVDQLTYTVTEEKNGFLGFGSSVTATVFAPADVQEFIKNYLATFFENLDFPIDITVTLEDNTYHVDLNAENNAIIIGRGGQSLHGLSQVLRNATNNRFKQRFYIILDVNNYKEERHSKVSSLARRIGKNVQKTRIDATLDPMPNDERKVIHQTLSNYDHIETISEGDGAMRRVIIKYID
ncbi:MAG: KH domain-containing protein [Erysipelothrix sp.]|nr:KH domain-containing protein [Erysipelothrix sp.]